MELPNLEEIKEQKLVPDPVESETTLPTEEAETPAEETQKERQDTEPETKADEEVPASFQKRIDELVYKYKSEREARLKLEEEFRAKRDNPTKATTDEEKKEQAARDYLRNLYHEIVAEEKSKESEEDSKLRDEVGHVSALYPDFQEKAVLSIMDEFGIANVETAYKAWKKMGRVVQETKDQTKKELIAKPKSPSSVKTQDSIGQKFTPEQIHEKSLWQLAEEIKKEAGFN